MIKSYVLSVLALFLSVCINAQTQQSAAEFQKELNADYKNPEKSPLKSKAKRFKGHDFFSIDSVYIVNAKFVRAINPLPFKMETSTTRLPTYEKYGEAHFEIKGTKMKLHIYQSHNLRETEEHKNHLFLPFTDLTNGEESYIGGRYIDLQIPVGDSITIDFNKAYNPYCAYSKNYSCPIPPQENHLDFKIYAGIKKPKK